jgi:2-methylcitrate dehydratase PrpD
MAALFAERGLTGPRNILQGRGGFYNIFEPLHDLDRLTIDLGKRFEGVTAAFKAYPCCSATHSSINATLDLVIENDIRPEDVLAVEVGVNRTCYDVVCIPRDLRERPRNIVNAQFSIPYTVATAIVKREVFLDDFTKESIKRPEVLELAKKVETKIDPDIEKSEPERMGTSIVRIRTKNGKEYSKRLEHPIGYPENPFTWSYAVQKFRKCCAYSAVPLPDGIVDDLIRTVSHLEELDDVTAIIRLITPN